ncbi:BREX-1 system phosphatase PglZ type A [Methanothermobacter sp. KEPCO 2]|uniref:BREX-1 system phosphatase PglZ type A n=1 Tax=Methanothermobacter sp. KEPCO 2 TaxID=3240977 RepID=UPI0035171AC8
MNLKYIQKKLNQIFKGDERRIVVWYDDDAEFRDIVNELELENARIHHLRDNNQLYTKYLLEVEDTVNSYLIYAPFPRPSDEENYLADIVYYSTPFAADRISLIIQELKIPEHFRPVLEKYRKFWNADSRIGKFEKLNIDDYSDENIKIGILCVLAGVKVPNFDELLKKVLIEDFHENRYLSEFEKMGILEDFWELCRKRYGYSAERPTIKNFLITLLITYTATRFRGTIPGAWEKLISERENNVTVFISNLLNNTHYRDKYDEVASYIAESIRIEEHIKKIPPECYLECGTFEVFDRKIIEHNIDLLLRTGSEIRGLDDVLTERKRTHFYGKYRNHYEVLKWANSLIGMINIFSEESSSGIDDFVEKYCSKWYMIDLAYRKFYYAYDRLPATDKPHDLAQLIENMYINTYLSKLNRLWSMKLKKISIEDLKYDKQHQFYRKHVAPSINKHRTAVIISDALRYECGFELCKKLNQNPMNSAEIQPIISSIPSYTALGMAALLPHDSITFTDDCKVLVDGRAASSVSERGRILEENNENSLTWTHSEVMSLRMEDLREKIKNRDLIYIYHNQIDARGDKQATESEVFNAASEAIEELLELIKKLTNQAGISNYIITADHGFIYRRGDVPESDRIEIPYGEFKLKNKRFIISEEDPQIEGTLTFSLDYLGMDHIMVTVPESLEVFKISGGGHNFVHGGTSIQEVIIPLIKLKSRTGKTEQRVVDLKLVSIDRRLTNLNSYLTFVQTESVSETVLPLEAKIYFEDENGERISNEVIIHASSRASSPREREFREKFTLRHREYSNRKKYYLVIKNMENDVELERCEFTIDIPFSDDFVF